jgi:hypothetical protein
MPCTVVLSGGDKLSFEDEPDEMANLLAPHKTGPNGFVKIERGTGAVLVNPSHVVCIRPLEDDEVATP